jgi:uncharacterized protein (TIGR00251 family)
MNWKEGRTGAAITVKITPRSSKNEVSEILSDGTIKIRITAAPVDGKANEMLIRYLAEILHVPASNIDIVAGQSGRDKLISITGITPARVTEILTSEVNQ